MVATEVVLIIIGVVFVLGSFFVTEKLSQKDLDHISLMSEADLKHMAEKQVKDMKTQLESSVDDIIDDSLEITKRGLERETNKKIMAVSEYSDTVMENINKTHNEIMFLYSMLNDKQTETAELIADLQRYVKQVRDLDLENVIAKLETQAKPKTKTKSGSKSKSKKKAAEGAVETAENAAVAEALGLSSVVTAAKESLVDETLNKNEQILMLYKKGKSEVEIAKALDCGLGEIRLVLGLYHEA